MRESVKHVHIPNRRGKREKRANRGQHVCNSGSQWVLAMITNYSDNPEQTGCAYVVTAPSLFLHLRPIPDVIPDDVTCEQTNWSVSRTPNLGGVAKEAEGLSHAQTKLAMPNYVR